MTELTHLLLLAASALVVVTTITVVAVRLLARELAASRAAAAAERDAHLRERRELLLHLRDPVAAVGHSFALSDHADQEREGAPSPKLWTGEADEVDARHRLAAEIDQQLAARGVEL